MKQQVRSPDHSKGIMGKKASNKSVKGDDLGKSGRRLGGDGSSLDEELKPALNSKMSGGERGRLKGPSSAHHSKEHKGSRDVKDHKHRKGEKEKKEYNDQSKATAEEDVEMRATEAMDEEPEGRKRRGQADGTLLQWGNRKRLCSSVRTERRVTTAAQPASQPRGNVLRPLNASLPEAASGAAKRTSDVSGSAAVLQYSEFDPFQGSTTTGHEPQSGDEGENRQQHPDSEKAPASNGNGGSHTVVAALSFRRAFAESIPEKPLALESMSLDRFEWPKIVTSLTKKEKEDDFSAIKGTKLPQRLKRRPKAVEKNVQFINPGTWLCDLTRERYEVREQKTVKKEPRGLKAMGNVDSDSD